VFTDTRVDKSFTYHTAAAVPCSFYKQDTRGQWEKRQCRLLEACQPARPRVICDCAWQHRLFETSLVLSRVLVPLSECYEDKRWYFV